MKENLIENTNIQKLLGEKLPNIKMPEGVMNANSNSKYTKDLKRTLVVNIISYLQQFSSP